MKTEPLFSKYEDELKEKNKPLTSIVVRTVECNRRIDSFNQNLAMERGKLTSSSSGFSDLDVAARLGNELLQRLKVKEELALDFELENKYLQNEIEKLRRNLVDVCEKNKKLVQLVQEQRQEIQDLQHTNTYLGRNLNSLKNQLEKLKADRKTPSYFCIRRRCNRVPMFNPSSSGNKSNVDISSTALSSTHATTTTATIPRPRKKSIAIVMFNNGGYPSSKPKSRRKSCINLSSSLSIFDKVRKRRQSVIDTHTSDYRSKIKEYCDVNAKRRSSSSILDTTASTVSRRVCLLDSSHHPNSGLRFNLKDYNKNYQDVDLKQASRRLPCINEDTFNDRIETPLNQAHHKTKKVEKKTAKKEQLKSSVCSMMLQQKANDTCYPHNMVNKHEQVLKKSGEEEEEEEEEEIDESVLLEEEEHYYDGHLSLSEELQQAEEKAFAALPNMLPFVDDDEWDPSADIHRKQESAVLQAQEPVKSHINLLTTCPSSSATFTSSLPSRSPHILAKVVPENTIHTKQLVSSPEETAISTRTKAGFLSSAWWRGASSAPEQPITSSTPTSLPQYHDNNTLQNKYYSRLSITSMSSYLVFGQHHSQ